MYKLSTYLFGFLILPLAMAAQQPAQPPAQAAKRNCWLRDADSPAAATAYLLCEQGHMWVTTDAGKTWSTRNTGATVKMRAFDWLDANRGVAIGDNGTVLATADGGKTWQPRQAGVKDHLVDITFAGESGWISGYRGVMLQSADGGKTWAPQITKTTMTLEGIFFADQNHGWAVGWSGTILRTADGGKTWTQVKSEAAQWTLFSVYFRDLDNGWITGFGGQILRSKDGGATWKAQDSPVKSSLNSVSFDSAHRGWITYDDGFLLSEDSGETWTQLRAPGRPFLNKLLPVDKALWAVGQSVVLQQSGTGKEWKKIDSLVANTALPAPAAADGK